MNRPIKIAAVGDIGFHGKTGLDILAHGPGYPFALVSPIMEKSDILFGNLEIPFAPEGEGPARRDISPALRAFPATVDSLAAARFDVVSLANNHIMDYGRAGLELTLSLLDSKKIRHTGAGMTLDEARRPAMVEKDGRRIAFLAYAMKGPHTAGPEKPGAAPGDERLITEDISSLRERCEAVIVSIHFGMMYTDYPKQEDQEMTRRLIDAGAAAVIGHHPHVTQGIESYRQGVIAYSLGEFLFDPSSGFIEARHMKELRRESIILELTVTGEGTEAGPVPVCIGEDLRPGPCDEERNAEIIERIGSISAALSGYDIDFETHLAQRTMGHELKVLLYNLRRFNLGYVIRKLARVRPRHIRALISNLIRK